MAPTAPRTIQIKPNMLQGEDFAAKHFRATIPNDWSLEEILKPGAWVHVAGQITPGTSIVVTSADYQFDVELRVVKVDRGLVFTNLLRKFETPDHAALSRQHRAAATTEEAQAEENLPTVPTGYKVGFAPNGGGHWARFTATGFEVAKGKKTRREAIEAAIQHAKDAGTYEDPAKVPDAQAA